MLNTDEMAQIKEVVGESENHLAMHFLRVETRLKNQIEVLEDKVDEKYDKIITNTDAILKIVSDFRDEQVIVSKDQELHKKWFNQIAEETKLVFQD